MARHTYSDRQLYMIHAPTYIDRHKNTHILTYSHTKYISLKWLRETNQLLCEHYMRVTLLVSVVWVRCSHKPYLACCVHHKHIVTLLVVICWLVTINYFSCNTKLTLSVAHYRRFHRRVAHKSRVITPLQLSQYTSDGREHNISLPVQRQYI